MIITTAYATHICLKPSNHHYDIIVISFSRLTQSTLIMRAQRADCEHVRQHYSKSLLLFNISKQRVNERKKKENTVECTGGMKCYKIKVLLEFHFQLLDCVQKQQNKFAWAPYLSRQAYKAIFFYCEFCESKNKRKATDKSSQKGRRKGDWILLPCSKQATNQTALWIEE